MPKRNKEPAKKSGRVDHLDPIEGRPGIFVYNGKKIDVQEIVANAIRTQIINKSTSQSHSTEK